MTKNSKGVVVLVVVLAGPVAGPWHFDYAPTESVSAVTDSYPTSVAAAAAADAAAAASGAS